MDVETAGLSDYGKHGEYVGRQVKTWTRQYEASKTGEIPAMDKVIAWLPANIPAQRRTSVVHGDFRVDNLIYDRWKEEKEHLTQEAGMTRVKFWLCSTGSCLH